MEQVTRFVSSFGTQFSTWSEQLDMNALAVVSAIFLVVFLARNLMSAWTVKSLELIAEKIQISLDETVKEAILPAARALVLSLPLYGLLEALSLPSLLDQTLQRLVISVAVASIFAAGYSLVDVTVSWIVSPKDRIHGLQLSWLKKILKALTVIVGITAVLRVWEIDLGPVLTGMGVLGAGVALAAQDLFRNLIAGMASMGEKRFDIGDWVRVEGVVEGVVEKMELRSTLIRQFDQAAVHVPNAELANTTLINFTRRPFRRIYWTLDLTYGTSTEQLETIRDQIDQYIESSGDFAPKENAGRYVRISDFSDSSIQLLVWCFTNTIDYSEYLSSKERLLLKVKQIVEDSGSSFAYPTRTIRMAEDPETTDG
ncbi:MAG: mechanosensitive ion channel family protein [Roseibium sp.]|uniref:mechanosensitive ion channel family protein n=1 Tax=Roseibium sp. TaxID=1936156 RepID=UPI001B0A3389|nr:mechanosensitive ion channel family protein [Roseibium sp.]MBO6895423.1 mechanosensitive ion channel family protein [Roseibium sp.]MBO6929997.1 mechanosensitive ion channel family protein [Roseibium sp.]